MAIASYISGFSLSLSLILPIGAQNAFVLRQGLKQEHVFFVCLACALSDAILISLGVSGFGAIVKAFPWIDSVARFGGASFLILYALLSFKSAYSQTHKLNPDAAASGPLLKTLLICLALTWLNPHVYLDTVVLLGSVSTQYDATRLQFAMGAISASFVFFFSLGFGAKILIPVFRQPRAWRIFETIMGLMLLLIAAKLLLR